MKKALLIGINNYPDCPLSGCINDIEQVKSAIERNEDGSPNFEVMLMRDAQNSADVANGIRQLFDGDGEFSLLYFSGHGYKNDLGVEIVMPDSISSTGSYSTGIKMIDIMKIVNNSNVKNKTIVLDCCHSGFIGKTNDMGDASLINPGVSILTACTENESAVESNGHGLFTELFCQALNGGASDYCGNITIGGIYAYIDRAFGAWDQRPIFKTNVNQFAPLKKVNPQIPIEVIRELTKLFDEPNTDFMLDPSFEFTNDPNAPHTISEPYALPQNIKKFKTLQKLQSIGFVEPVGTQHMYFAAMESKSCRLTKLGKYYWRLVNDGRI